MITGFPNDRLDRGERSSSRVGLRHALTARQATGVPPGGVRGTALLSPGRSSSAVSDSAWRYGRYVDVRTVDRHYVWLAQAR
jgi:hypothetical protein